MARGLKKHLKRLNAPKHWMLDKLGGAFAPKPSAGPHKGRECLPLVVLLRNRLKYALTYREVIAIVMQRLIAVDGKVRTDKCYPAGFMDVVSIAKTNENFRLLYDAKGRFRLHSIKDEEAKYKLCKVRGVQFGDKGIPYLNTYDGRTIRYPDPLVKANDTIKIDLETGRSIRVALRLFMSRILLGRSSQHDRVMCLPLERVQSLGYLYQRAKVSSCQSLKKPRNVMQLQLLLLNFGLGAKPLLSFTKEHSLSLQGTTKVPSLGNVVGDTKDANLVAFDKDIWAWIWVEEEDGYSSSRCVLEHVEDNDFVGVSKEEDGGFDPMSGWIEEEDELL
ncbi:hypothetical protein SUGI_0265710 [Cryptomeria japonica]|nr:hypothetical protein SUGI_0265710 [Cryptomeria japonica]